VPAFDVSKSYRNPERGRRRSIAGYVVTWAKTATSCETAHDRGFVSRAFGQLQAGGILIAFWLPQVTALCAKGRLKKKTDDG
jgi:hypothetical protein